jgi:NADH-quinone oxidoreductase subunit E
MLGLAFMRALEVASFYFMFQLKPVGSVAHIQVCGTTSCMICGAEDLVAVCQDKIAKNPHDVSADGKFSWEEVECLGSCSNAPMAQIGKDYYEDLTSAKMADLIDALARGEVPLPGPQNGRYAAEPLSGLTTLTEYAADKNPHNASVQLARDIGDTIKRIDGTEVPLLAPWQMSGPAGPTSGNPPPATKQPATKPAAKSKPAAKQSTAKAAVADVPAAESKPRTMTAPRQSGADDLKRISGVGPKLETTLNEMGFWHFDQIAKWSDDEVSWVDSRLKFKGRIRRDDWIAQAAAFSGEK